MIITDWQRGRIPHFTKPPALIPENVVVAGPECPTEFIKVGENVEPDETAAPDTENLVKTIVPKKQ